MRVTIDSAGRLAIPKPLRDAAGIAAGEVEATVARGAIRIEAPASGDLAEREGRLIIPQSGAAINDVLVRVLRDVDQR